MQMALHLVQHLILVQLLDHLQHQLQLVSKLWFPLMEQQVCKDVTGGTGPF